MSEERPDPPKITPGQDVPGTGGGKPTEGKGVGCVDQDYLALHQPSETNIQTALRTSQAKDGEGKGVGTGAAHRLKAFNWQKKRRWLRWARQFWPNVARICALTGVSTGAYYGHLRTDPIFAYKVKELDSSVTDKIEGVLAQQAEDPKSFLDRISYLRAHRPELYDRAKKIVVENVSPDPERARQRLARARGAVDAEIVKSALDHKEQKRLRQGMSELVGGDGTEGEKAGGSGG